MGLQGAGAALVFSESHSWVRVDWVALLRAAGAVLLAVSGAVLMIAAVRTLGKQWSLTARVLEDHELVTSGPYRLVRHPIYTGLVALVLARDVPVGVVYGIWVACGVALTAVLGRLLFRDPLTFRMVIGIALIMAGVVAIEVGSHSA